MGCAHVPGVAFGNRGPGYFVKIVLFANTDWYLYNYRLPLARALRQRRHEVLLLSPDGAYSTRLKEAGFKWEAFPLSRRGKNPFYELGTLWRLARFYRRERPEAVQHFTIKCVLYGSLAARWAGVKRVINAIPGLGHVFVSNRWQDRWLRWFVKEMYKFALRGTFVIFQNPDDQALFSREKLVEDGQQRLIRGSGVDMSCYVSLPEPDGVPLVVLPARMLWAKGIEEFVEAGRSLRESGIEARFVLAGDSDTATAGAVPPSQLEAWQKEGVVEWWGWQEDIISVYQKAHIICLPSYYGEGVPRSLVEAAACGRAVIGADTPGCREIVHHGVNGLLVPPRDSQALAGAIRYLVENPSLRREMGAKGREVAAIGFSLDKVIAENLALYELPFIEPGDCEERL